jgi:DNA replication protein DnaC
VRDEHHRISREFALALHPRQLESARRGGAAIKMSHNQLSIFRKRFEKYDLVILDELGYVSMDKAGCEMLFNLISSRNDKGSIIVTSNLTFERWKEIFKDPTLICPQSLSYL